MAENGKTPAKRGLGRPFSPGESANPGGRPKMPETVKAYLQVNGAQLTIECIETLRKWARSKSGKLAIAAATNLLKKTLPDTVSVDLAAAVELEHVQHYDFSRLTDDEIKSLRGLLERATPMAAVTPAPRALPDKSVLDE